jgi:hypothetical protein
MTDQLIETVNLLQQYGSIRSMARETGIPRSTIQDRLRAATRAGIYRNDFEVEALPSSHVSVADLIARRKLQYEQKRKHEEAARLINVKIRMDGPIGILHFGDPHVDDDGTDIFALERHAEIVRKTPGMFGGNIGDSTNNWVGRLARLYGEQSTSAQEAWQLAEWFLNSVDWLYLIGGNHDAWSGAGDPIPWITRNCLGVKQGGQARMGLNFPNGKTVTVNAHHNWPGNSQWNPAHGQMKAAQMGFADHIVISGHKHSCGYGVVKNPATGLISHCIQLGSYKIYDRFAKEMGFKDQHISPCAVTIIDPSASEAGQVQMFWEPEEAAEYLTFKRRKFK